MAVQWRGIMTTGSPTLDNDHQILLGLLNKVEEAAGTSDMAAVGRVLADLLEYAEGHFDREEKVQADIHFAEKDAHKLLHDDLRAKAFRLNERFNAFGADSDKKALAGEIHVFLNDWLMEHILKEDLKMRPLLDKLYR